jgi:uncharacterized membrane protein YfcA
MRDRGMWIGAAVAVVGSCSLAAIGASLVDTVNGPGSRAVAPPVLWALGGGAGLVLGALVGAFVGRRFRSGAVAAFLGAIALLVLVVLAYNSSGLRTEDQVVGTLIVVVLPGFVVALGAAALGSGAARLFRRGQPARA